jgi:hypothetical protein
VRDFPRDFEAFSSVDQFFEARALDAVAGEFDHLRLGWGTAVDSTREKVRCHKGQRKIMDVG